MDITILKFLRVIKPTSVSLGSMVGSSNFTKFYVFTALPFGLSFAPHIFTKTLKPLEKHRRHQGICIAIFLDDGWGIEKDRQVCSSIAKVVKTDLGEAGFVTSDEKSIWEPCQRIDWFGVTWDSARGTIGIVDRRFAKILSTIYSIVDSGFAAYFCKKIGFFHRANYFYITSFREYIQNLD